ncbi:MAG: class I SAM-dependent RNA methyltransferase [Anaerolineales bacterium]
MAADQTVDIDLNGMAYGGEAFGRDADGRMVFVAFGLPGERVRVRLLESHQRWARAELLEVLQPAGNRAQPRCLHFGTCGGCAYQHLSYQDQLATKQAILEDQFRRLGGLADPPIKPTIPSPEPWNYRNRLRFHLTPSGELAFHTRATGAPFPVQECHLPTGPVNDLWPRIELEAYEGLDAVEIRADSQGERSLLLHADQDPQLSVDLDLAATVVWLGPAGAIVLAGDPFGRMQVGNRTFQLSPASFFQTNSALVGTLVQRAVALVDPQPGQVVFDLFAGVGLFSAFLADAGADVVAIEESASACADFEVNLAAFDRVDLYESTVTAALPAVPQGADAILLDPPRAGLAPEVIDELVRRRPARLVYVSCDPATLARDGKRLTRGGYTLVEAIPIDMFPQTASIESLSLWQR